MAEDALAIYQACLDDTADALLAGDVARFLHRIHFPHRIVTKSGVIDILDEATGAAHFKDLLTSLRAQNVDAYVRSAKTAAFDGPDSITGTHVVRILSRGKLVAPVFESEMDIVRGDDGWAVAEIRHHIDYMAWPKMLPRVSQP